MFQTEFSRQSSAPTPDVRATTAARHDDVTHVLALIWEEHCTECAFPTCYATCSLYRRRDDGHCARFDDGIRAVSGEHLGAGYAADLTFGRWAKLEAELPRRRVRLAVSRAAAAGAVERRLASSAHRLMPDSLEDKLSLRYSRARRSLLHRIGRATDSFPDALEVDVWSDHDQPYRLIVETAGSDGVVRTSITVRPGTNIQRIPAAELGLAGPGWPERIMVYPENDLHVRVVVRWLELVWLTTPPPAAHTSPVAQPAAKVKCLVWDLDNTLWDGTLVEDGPEGLRLDPQRIALLNALDQRGILLSVASKNDLEPALAALDHFGIRHLFLAPQASWGPKSAAIAHLATVLNLGLDAFAFVDDSAFERGEVAEQLGSMRIYEPADLAGLLDRPEFDVPVTAESQGRRQLYAKEAERQQLQATFGGDGDTFLRSCQLHLEVFTPSTDEEVARCLELFQRTNQMNLTTRRLTAEQLAQRLADPDCGVLGLRADDRFGEYGIIGVAVIDWPSPGEDARLTDFLTSCRVARKGIEQAFFEWLRSQLAANGSAALVADLIPTDRNHILAEVLAEVGFSAAAATPDGVPLRLPTASVVPRSDLVSVEERDVHGPDRGQP